jgi:type IV pilus assembly protein PilC
MSIYSYKALDVNGNQVRGKITADNDAELENKLKQSGLDLLDASIVNDVNFLNSFGGVSLQEIILICLHLHHLEKAGVPILDSIGDLRDTSTNPKVKEVMMDLYDSLRNGLMLSEAMAKHPKVFDNIFIGLIRTGERTGNLAEVFEHLEHHYKWVTQLHKKVKKATYYPLFLFILMCGVIGLMMGFVIPKITVFLVAQNIPLPMYTVALINTSNFILKNWAIILSAPIAIYILIKFLCIRSSKFAYFFDNIKLKAPVLGNVIRKIEIARFCHFFGYYPTRKLRKL